MYEVKGRAITRGDLLTRRLSRQAAKQFAIELAEVSRRHSTHGKKKCEEGLNMDDKDMSDMYIEDAKKAENRKKK